MRRSLHVLHRWTGLTVGLLVLLQVATGLLWTFQEPLTVILHPGARVAAAPPASLDRILAAVAHAYPTGDLQRIQVPQQGARPLAALLRDQGQTLVLLIDPSTARVLSSGPLWAYPEQFAEQLHGGLLMGTTGHAILALEGLAIVVLAASGVVQWWPRLARGWAAFAVDLRAPWPKRLRDIHSTIGVLAAVFVVLIGATGALLAAEPQVSAVVSWFAPAAPESGAVPTPGPARASEMSAQEALAALRARFPTGRLMGLRTRENGLVAAFVQSGTANPMTYQMGVIDRNTGALTVLADPKTQSPADAFTAWLPPIHTGAIFGALRTPFALAAAIALGGLVLSGLAQWLIRRRRVSLSRRTTR